MKKHVPIKFWLTSLLLSCSLYGTAQQAGVIITADEQAFNRPLPPIKAILDSAMNNSPLLQLNKLEYEQAIISLTEIRQRWTDYFYLEGTARYGLLNHLTISQLDTEQAASYGLLTQNEQLNYYAGVSVKFPISEFLKRRTEKRKVQLELQQSRVEQEQIRNEIQGKVIEQYYLLKYYQERMNSFQEVLQTIEVSYLDGKRSLEKGHLKLDEFARISEARGKAKDGYLKAMNEYYAQYKIVEVIIGMSMDSL